MISDYTTWSTSIVEPTPLVKAIMKQNWRHTWKLYWSNTEDTRESYTEATLKAYCRQARTQSTDLSQYQYNFDQHWVGRMKSWCGARLLFQMVTGQISPRVSDFGVFQCLLLNENSIIKLFISLVLCCYFYWMTIPFRLFISMLCF